MRNSTNEPKRLSKNMTKKEKIVFLVTIKGLDSYKAIAKRLNCSVKEVRDYIWCIQNRDGMWMSVAKFNA